MAKSTITLHHRRHAFKPGLLLMMDPTFYRYSKKEKRPVIKEENKKTFQTMTGSELVQAYNAMVDRLKFFGNENYRRISRFADLGQGRARCEAIASSLKAAESSLESTEKGKRMQVKNTDDLGFRKGSKGQVLFQYLQNHVDQQIPLQRVCREIYKSDTAPEIENVLNGIRKKLAEKAAPFQLERSKTEHGRTLCLKRK